MTENDTNIDPSQPVMPLKVSAPVPGAFTVEWTAEDWHAWEAKNGEAEPLVLVTRTMGRWIAAGRNSAGVLLYRRDDN